MRAVRSRQSGWQTILSGRRSAKGRHGDACGVCTFCRKFDSGNSEDVIAVGAEGSVKDKDIELLISAAMKKSYTGRPVFLVVRGAGRIDGESAEPTAEDAGGTSFRCSRFCA